MPPLQLNGCSMSLFSVFSVAPSALVVYSHAAARWAPSRLGTAASKPSAGLSFSKETSQASGPHAVPRPSSPPQVLKP
eukprot:scaffold1894_cov153-Pinguiococcus_pyrenoidosus.AAC.1